MTLTIEISPEVERELTLAAAHSGRGLSEWIVATARAVATQPSAAENEADEAEARRLRAVNAGWGMFAGSGRIVDDFLADRHAESEAEYDKWIEGQKRAKNAAGESA